MTTMCEGNLTFTFPTGWKAEKYDEWPIYINQIQGCCGGLKGIDFVAIDPSGTLWLIEVKDYRTNRREKPMKIWEEIAKKSAHTLSGLVIAAKNQHHSHNNCAINCLHANSIRIVLHLEQPYKPSKLFPRLPYDPADIQMKLKQMVKPIDAHPMVVAKANLPGIYWTVI